MPVSQAMVDGRGLWRSNHGYQSAPKSWRLLKSMLSNISSWKYDLRES